MFEKFFKGITKSKAKNVGLINDKENILTGKAILINSYVDICCEACACCWDKPVPEKFEDKLRYLYNRVKIGHESVIEHSNLVTFFKVPEKYAEDLFEFSSCCKYLNIRIHHSEKYPLYYVLIGGSIRGYKNIYRDIKDLNNVMIGATTDIMYTHCHKELFVDFINDGIMEENNFNNLVFETTGFNNYNTDDYDIINVDSIKEFCYTLSKECEEYELFSIYELVSMVSITVLFKNMSRTATHQLVRHRNGITQESQRYVDYSQAAFANPAKFKPERYDPKEIYHIRLKNPSNQGEDKIYNINLNDLGDMLQSIYEQLINPAANEGDAITALLKEDARGFLPSNIECKKLYMTFTYKTFFKFLELRTDKAAQAEIRTKYANNLESFFRQYINDNKSFDYFNDNSYVNNCLENFYDFNQPAYKYFENTTAQYVEIDEIIEEKEEVINNPQEVSDNK